MSSSKRVTVNAVLPQTDFRFRPSNIVGRISWFSSPFLWLNELISDDRISADVKLGADLIRGSDKQIKSDSIL